MLQAIRGKTASILVKLLAGLLIVSFAAWGIEDFISARATDVSVASVGDEDIDPLTLEYELSRETQRLRRSFGGALTDEQMIGLGMGNAVLQRLINDAALNMTARELGLSVTDELVVRSIQADPSFRGFDGTFSRARFEDVMRSIGMTEQRYIEQVRENIANTQLLEAFGGSGAVPKKLAELVREFRFESRTAETLLVAAADQPEPGTPTDAALQKIYEEQSERFMAPEYRTFTYVHIDPASLMGGIKVSDEDLKAAYDANAAQFIQPEQRTVQQMVLTDEETANKAAKALAEGRSFEDVAVEVAGMEKAAIDLGTLTRDGLLPSLADAAFAAPEGTPTAPVKSPLGWHILRTTKIEPGVEKKLSEVRDQVRDIVAKEKSVDAMYDLSVRFEDAIGGGSTLEEAASSIGATAVKVEGVDRTGQDRTGVKATLPDIASLLPTAFSTSEGTESPLSEAGDKGYFTVRVDQVTKPTLRPLDEVRAEVTEAWKAVERTASAEAKAKELADKANAGTAMTALAEQVPGDVETVGPTTRKGGDNVERTVLARMFEIQPNTAGIAKISTGYVVVKVTGVSAPAGDGVPSAAEMATELDTDIGNDIAAQMIEAMRQNFGVTINQRVYQQVIRPGPYDPRSPS